MKRKKMLIAHRGLSATYPENTLPAFEQALRLDVDAIEFDVHMSRDGELVITHDDRIDRCSNGTGRVRDLTFEELRRLDFGNWKAPEFAGTRIPTLTEVLDLVEERRPGLYLCVELKEDDCVCARKVIRELERRNRLGNCSIISFQPGMLYFARGMNENVFPHGFIHESELGLPEKEGYLKLACRAENSPEPFRQNCTPSASKSIPGPPTMRRSSAGCSTATSTRSLRMRRTGSFTC